MRKNEYANLTFHELIIIRGLYTFSFAHQSMQINCSKIQANYARKHRVKENKKKKLIILFTLREQFVSSFMNFFYI